MDQLTRKIKDLNYILFPPQTRHHHPPPSHSNLNHNHNNMNKTETMHDSALGDSRISDCQQEGKDFYPIKQLSKADKQSFQLKRIFKPHKIYYELEHRDSWLQLDEHTSKGIERIRKLGFSNLDVRLDQRLSQYFSSQEVLVEINYLPFINKDIHTLLRLRKVHWWSKNYHLVIAALHNNNNDIS